MFDFFWTKKKTDRAKILVVDDEPNIVQTLQDRLEMNDYKVITAGNGKEGLDKAIQGHHRAPHPDLWTTVGPDAPDRYK